jgi:hypothetical protein
MGANHVASARKPAYLEKTTERGGFEPPVPNGYTAFPMLLLQPLRHLSKGQAIIPSLMFKEQAEVLLLQ